MKYRNKVTKVVIETNGKISGDNWEEVKGKGRKASETAEPKDNAPEPAGEANE